MYIYSRNAYSTTNILKSFQTMVKFYERFLSLNKCTRKGTKLEQDILSESTLGLNPIKSSCTLPSSSSTIFEILIHVLNK